MSLKVPCRQHAVPTQAQSKRASGKTTAQPSPPSIPSHIANRQNAGAQQRWSQRPPRGAAARSRLTAHEESSEEGEESEVDDSSEPMPRAMASRARAWRRED